MLNSTAFAPWITKAVQNRFVSSAGPATLSTNEGGNLAEGISFVKLINGNLLQV